MSFGIYRWLNKVNGKVYIGQTVDLSDRQRSHRNSLNNGTNKCKMLQKAWDKHGEDSFTYERVEEVSDRYLLTEREQYWVDFYDSANPKKGYNIVKNVGSGPYIRKTNTTKAPRTEEHRKKLSEALKGHSISIETREKMRRAKLGTKMSEEQKQKISESAKRWASSPENKQRVSEWSKNRTRTPEENRKRSESGKKRHLLRNQSGQFQGKET